jgi:hypothetical protein
LNDDRFGAIADPRLGRACHRVAKIVNAYNSSNPDRAYVVQPAEFRAIQESMGTTRQDCNLLQKMDGLSKYL